MKIKQTKSKDVLWVPRRIHRSPAFRKLTTTSILVYLEFKYRCQYQKAGTKGNWHHVNNGELIFPYSEAWKKFKIYRSTFCRSISQLVELGFIDIAHQGGGMLKDCSKYGISDRWQDYGKEEFKNKTRQKDTRKLGFTKDNWEKQTGRKRKNKSEISITDNTKSGITGDTYKYKKPKNLITSSTNHATLKTDPNYYIQKGLEVFETMHPTQYH